MQRKVLVLERIFPCAPGETIPTAGKGLMMRRTHDDNFAGKRDREIAEKQRDVELKRPFACRLALSRTSSQLQPSRPAWACENRFRVISIILFSGKNRPAYTGFPCPSSSQERPTPAAASRIPYRLLAWFPGSINQRHLLRGSPLESDKVLGGKKKSLSSNRNIFRFSRYTSKKDRRENMEYPHPKYVVRIFFKLKTTTRFPPPSRPRDAVNRLSADFLRSFFASAFLSRSSLPPRPLARSNLRTDSFHDDCVRSRPKSRPRGHRFLY